MVKGLRHSFGKDVRARCGVSFFVEGFGRMGRYSICVEVKKVAAMNHEF